MAKYSKKKNNDKKVELKRGYWLSKSGVLSYGLGSSNEKFLQDNEAKALKKS